MENPIVVLHAAQPTDAGVPAVVVSLVRDQLARGWRVTVAAPRRGRLSREVVGSEATYIEWEATRSPGPHTAMETRALGRVLTDVRPDIVHLHSSKAGTAGRLATRGRLPTVFQPHGWSFWAATGMTAAGARWWERAAARWTDALVCVGQSERAAGLAAGISAPFVVVPNGVDLTRWVPASEADKQEARARFGLGPEPIALCVGRLTKQKGQDLLVASWRQVRDLIPDARLILVGDGIDRAALERDAGPGVELVGHSEDVAGWIAASDVIVLPSRWEGMSLALLEAMARARPVVATDVAGMREVLAGGGGEVVPIGDPSALARAIASRLGNRQILAAEGVRGRKTIEEHHDLNATTDRIAQVYAEVLDRRADHVYPKDRRRR